MNHVFTLIEALQARNEGDVAVLPARFTSSVISFFLTKRTPLMELELESIGHARVDTAIVILWFDTGQDGEALEDKPFRTKMEVIPECVTQLVERQSRHVAGYLQNIGTDVVAVFS